jgi:hypothetical protein
LKIVGCRLSAKTILIVCFPTSAKGGQMWGTIAHAGPEHQGYGRSFKERTVLVAISERRS